MRTTEIEKQLRQRPFLPFRLRMTGGTSYEVRHPEMLMVSRTVMAVAIHESRGRAPEAIILCDPVHIVRIEPVGNGRPKSRHSSKY